MHLSSVTIRSSRFPRTSAYPFNLPLFHRTDTVAFCAPVTFFCGENGSGKSTLLKAIAKRCGIHIWAEDVWTRAHYNPLEESLFEYLDVEWREGARPGAFFSAETYDHMTRMIDLWASGDPGLLDYFGGSSLMELSHGESFMAFFRSRFSIEGIYFLDEPETALSPKRQLEFRSFLEETGKQGHAQFVIATHSPILLSCPGATVLSFDGTSIRQVGYADTEHFTLYQAFFRDHTALR